MRLIWESILYGALVTAASNARLLPGDLISWFRSTETIYLQIVIQRDRLVNTYRLSSSGWTGVRYEGGFETEQWSAR